MTSYRPTPLERAHASHLLATHFASPFDPTSPAADDDAPTLRLPGRTAVPFLTTSGVDRGVLRLVWSVADPDAVGTLTRRRQVHTLLRLVAMAQAHFLPPLPEGMADADKLNLLRETLQNTSHLVVALPTFGADECPSVAHLMGTYPPPPAVQDVTPPAAASMDVSTMLTDHDLQYQLWQKQQSGGGGSVAAEGSVGEERVMSVSDAFGSLGGVEDRPLPPLQPTPVVEERKVLEDVSHVAAADDGGDGFEAEDGDEFGTFDSVPAPLPMETMVTDQVPTAPADDFGDFDTAPIQPEASFGEFGGNVPVESVADAPIEGNEFGGFATGAEGLQGEDDDFGGFSGAPAVQNEASENIDMASNAMMDEIKTESSAGEMAEEDGADADFGGFGQAPVDGNAADSLAPGTGAAMPALESGGPTLSISDAFGSLVEQNQRTEMPIEDAADDVPPSAVTDTEDIVVDDEANDDEDFGDFEAGGQTKEPLSTDEFDDFGSGTDGYAGDAVEMTPAPFLAVDGVDPSSTTPGDNKLSVFDSLVEVEDAPLPTLGAFSAIGAQSEKVNEAEDDDFGDFEAGNGEEKEEDHQEDDFGDFEGTGVNEMPPPNDMVEDGSGLGEVSSAPVPPSNFGEVPPLSEPLSSTIEQNASDTPANEMDDEDEKMSAFDAFGDVQETPLPPLGSFSAVNEAPESEVKVAEEEGFSDLAGTGQDHSPSGEGELGNVDEFGDFEGTGGNDDGFGNFGDPSQVADLVDNVEEAATEPQVEDKLSVFDALAGVQDAPLPPLGTFPAIGENAVEEAGPIEDGTDETENDFGDFAGSGETENDPPLASNDDVAGETKEVGQSDLVTGAVKQGGGDPEASNNLGEEGNVLGFGAIEETSTDDNPSSVFDVFGEVRDAPLPSLGTFTSPADVSANMVAEANDEEDVDDFGDFEETVQEESADIQEPESGVTAEQTTQITDDASPSDLFDAFSSSNAPLSSLEASAPVEAVMGIDQDGDGFGAFGDHVATPAVAAKDEMQDASGFGDFNDHSDLAKPAENNDERHFGAFEATIESAAGNLTELAPEIAPASNAAVFESIPPPPLSSFPSEESEEMFGDFGGHDHAEEVQNNVDEDAFGGFEAFPAETSLEKTDEDDGWGDFGTPSAQETLPIEEDSFGNFGGHEPQTGDVALPTNNDDADDFGQFEAVSATTTEVAQTNEVTESFGQFEAHANVEDAPPSDDFGAFETSIAPQNDGAVESTPDDFGDGFGDFSTFETAAPQPGPEEGDLVELLRKNVGDEFGKLPADWKSVVISSVEKDLQRGKKVMVYLSSNLSSKDRALIVKSRKLREHIAGLAEFVRLVRSIAATIGDLLHVSKNVELQESTLSQWKDHAMIFDIIVIENLWSEISSKAVALGIVSQAPELQSVVEIRTGAVPLNARQKTGFCQLTLQPLENDEASSTKSPVEWRGKKFMACAANFCANRVPEYVV